MKRLLPILLLIVGLRLTAQTYDFAFQREQNISVVQNSHTLKMPWVGGMNSVRFSEIDLDLDGQKDFFAFEKNGNRVLPFVKTDSGYRYAPEYASLFPAMHDWVILKDYNHDGKEDIFTYGTAGIKVYQNVSDKSLKFKLISEQLQAYYYNGYSNIYASPDDYLAIEDIDGDGDLDILNFWILGKFVHYLRNYSVEKGGEEAFDFKLEDECWGKFAEGETNNAIELNVSCDSKGGDEPMRHVGSSIYARDFSGNGLMDIVVGDVDFPNLIKLTNGGSKDNALITAMDTAFPNANTPVDMYSMPAISFIDVDGDGVEEILVSPSDPSLTKSQNQNCVWLYHFDSLTNNYELQNKSFLQEEMIDVGGGAYPILYDWNGDGLQDLFIANYGTLDSAWFDHGYLQTAYSSSVAYYQNVGTLSFPKFSLVTADFGSLRKYGLQALYPAFGDIDGDGKTDLLCGQRDGTLALFHNDGTIAEPLFVLVDEHYAQIDVGDFSTPQLFDLDDDGSMDLLIGNRRGRVAYYRNEAATGAPQYQRITDTLGGIDVRDYETSYFGFAVPCFCKNSHGETVLFCGSEQGHVFYYLRDENGDFRLKEKLFEVRNHVKFTIDEGIRIAPCVADLNNDGYLDLLVGNYAGGVAYFNGIEPKNIVEKVPDIESNNFVIYPNPATDEVSVRTSNADFDEVRIFNVYGECVDIQSCQNMHFHVSALPSGMYIVDFYYRKARVGVAKLIK